MSNKPDMTNEQARVIGHFTQILEDLLRQGVVIANQGVERLNGGPGTSEMMAVAEAIRRLKSSPEFEAVRRIGIPPEPLTMPE